MSRQGDLADCMARLDACQTDEELRELCRECLAPNRRDRLPNAGVVTEKLGEYLQSVEQRLRQAEVGEAEQAARADEAQRTAVAAEAKSKAERRARILQLSIAAIVLLFSVGGAVVTSLFLKQQKQQTAEVANALDEKGDYLYVARIQMAEQAWQSGSVQRVRELLEQEDSDSTAMDRRTFEWFYFDRLCKQLNEIPSMDYGDIVTTMALTSDDKFLVAAGNDRAVQVYRLDEYQLIAELTGHRNKVVHLLAAADCRFIVSCDRNEFRIWRLKFKRL